MTTTCEYTRISPLFQCLSRLNFSLLHLMMVFYYSISLMVKIIAHFLHSVKWLKTRSLGRTVCFFADQVAQLSNIPDYFQYLKLRLSDDCPHCCKIIKRTKKLCPARGTWTPTVLLAPADFTCHYSFHYQISLFVVWTMPSPYWFQVNLRRVIIVSTPYQLKLI